MMGGPRTKPWPKPKVTTPARRKCSGTCGRTLPIPDMIHLGRAKYICPDCQASAAGEQGGLSPSADSGAAATTPAPAAEGNEAAVLAAAQELVDDGAATWEGHSTPRPDPGVAQALIDEASAAGLPLARGLSAPGSGSADDTAGSGLERPLPAPTTQPSDPPGLTMADVEAELEQRHDLANEPTPDWPLRYGRLSASAMASFMRCPEQFRREYVHGQRRAASGTMLAGTAAHKALEAIDRYRMTEGEVPPESWWSMWLEGKFDHEVTHQREPVAWKGDPAEWLASSRTAVKAYIADVLGLYQPLAVEEVFTMRVPGCPVPLVGLFDLRTTRAVVDRKFGGRTHSKVQPDWRVQGLIYSRASGMPVEWHSTGWPRKDGTCGVNTPANSADLQLPRTAANHQVAGDMVRSTVRAIQAYVAAYGVDEAWLGNVTHTWACDVCSFKENGCPWWQPKLRGLL